MDSERLHKAIEILIKDSESKFDEGTVDSLITELSKQTKTSWESELSYILNDHYYCARYKQYNLTRILKFHRAISLNIESAEALWRRLPQIIKKNNPSHVSATLLILKSLTNDKNGYMWIMDKRFSRPIKLTHSNKTIEIWDPVTISRYYMETSSNYHIQDYSKELLVSLLKQSCKFKINPVHKIVISAKKVIHELLRSRLPAICQVIIEIVENVYIFNQLIERYDILTEARQCFFQSIDNGDSRDLIPITKCYASLSGQAELNPAVEALRKKKNYEAIMAFVTHIHEEILPRAHMMYIVYPILSKCDSEDAQVLMTNLFITREDLNFLDRHMQDKFVLTSISYMRRILKKQSWISVWSTMNQQRFLYYLDVLTEYVKCNCTSQRAYKNVMESCHVLRGLETTMKRRGKEIGWLWGLTDNCLETIEKLNNKLNVLSENGVPSGENPDHFKSILMKVVQVMSVSHRIPSLQAAHAKNHQNTIKIIDLANRFDDGEILNIFTELFDTNPVLPLQGSSAETGEKFIDLVWNRIYPIGLKNDDHDLLGNVSKLLYVIDNEAEESMLAKVGLRRHHDIPRAFGEMLINYYTVPSLVEKIIRCLYDDKANRFIKPKPSDETIFSYLCFLDSSNLPKTVKPNLDHLLKGLCMTVKGESDSEIRENCVNMINDVIREFILNNDNETYLIERLVKTKIIETLYEVATGTMFSACEKTLAGAKLATIRRLIVKKNSKLIVEFISKDNPEERRLQRAQDVALFFSSDYKESKCQPSYRSSRMTLNQHVNDVLEELHSDHSIMGSLRFNQSA